MNNSQRRYYALKEMLIMIDEPNRNACLNLYDDNFRLFSSAFGSRHNHHAWEGGYHDHLQDAMNIAIGLHEFFSSLEREMDFTLSDLLLCVFLHDLEKPWKYEAGPEGKPVVCEALKPKDAQHQFRLEKAAHYGIVLTEAQEIGIRYAEGEIGDYSGTGRKMNQLAGLVHSADVTSARVFPGYPKEKHPWRDAPRVSDIVHV